jgi:hypothetical protein
LHDTHVLLLIDISEEVLDFLVFAIEIAHLQAGVSSLDLLLNRLLDFF